MKIIRPILTISALAAMLTPLVSGTVLAVASTSAAPSSSATTTDNTRLNTIKSKGDAELGRRLDTLNQILVNISDATRITPANKQTLSEQVSVEATALIQLRLKLAGETQVADAASDIAAMVTEYRVYALIVPKIRLIKSADDQMAAEQKLQDLQQKLATRISSAQNAGKNVSALQSKLKDMDTNVTAAQTLSSSVETEVLPLQPTDYDNDHTILSGYRDKLQTAKTDAQTAYTDAQAIVSGLKALK